MKLKKNVECKVYEYDYIRLLPNRANFDKNHRWEALCKGYGSIGTVVTYPEVAFCPCVMFPNGIGVNAIKDLSFFLDVISE